MIGSLCLASGVTLALRKMWNNKQAFMGENKYKVIDVTPKGYGFQFLFASLEQPILMCLGMPMLMGLLSCMDYMGHGPTAVSVLSWPMYLALFFAYPIYLVVSFLWMAFDSQTYGPAAEPVSEKLQDQYLVWKDENFKKQWYGKRMPIYHFVEAYQNQKIDCKVDLVDVMKNRYELFKFSFCLDHVKSLLIDLLARVWKHDSDADKADVSETYNIGNDFYSWFLCDRNLYSSGIWENSNEADLDDDKVRMERLNDSMTKKLDHICKDYCMMQEGMEHLDLGCGWGAMALHATGKYKVKTTGITLAQEQANYIAERDTENRCNIKVMNFWDLDEKENYKKFDVITCLEMSEHIGIRDYQAFVHKVRNMLKDDGVFYLQIAGLRRNWQYEDCIWALFMNKYIFPGADASCPLYWDVEQLERGGFEIRNVENMGPHYCLSIYSWYLNWRKNKAAVVAKYGEWLWRNYAVFLSWSYLIGNQGSSTVWMIRMNKALPHDARSRNQPAALTGKKGNAFGMERANWMVDGKLR